MRSTFPLVTVLCSSALVATAACGRVGPGSTHVGSGVAAKETRALAPFSKVRVTGGTEVHFRTGPAPKVEIECDADLLPLYESKVVGDELHLGFAPNGSYTTHVPLVVRVEAPRLAALESAGSIDATLEGLGGDAFAFESSGTAKLRASGSVGAARFVTRGSCELEAYQLQAERVEVDASGSSNAHVAAADALNVVIAGSGEVRYRGQPSVSQKVSGTGKVVPE